MIIITSAASAITNTFSNQNVIAGHAEKGKIIGTNSLLGVGSFFNNLAVAL